LTLVPPLTDGSADPSGEEPEFSTSRSGAERTAYDGSLITPVVPAPRVEESAPVDSGETGTEPVEEHPDAPLEKRRYPSTIGGAFYLAILAITVASVVIVVSGHWRGGIHWLAGALLAGSVLRFVLPERDAGMLAVRNRWLDGSLLAIFGGVLWFLATTLPDAA
jgi:hypothetical protein